MPGLNRRRPAADVNRHADEGRAAWPSRSAFSLIEMLVVIATIALLVALLLPTLHNARMRAREVTCMSSIRQVMLGYFSYTDDNRQYVLSYDFVRESNTASGGRGTYYWDETILNSYYSGGATRLFQYGCPGRDEVYEKRWYPGYPTWSYGPNGSIHGWVTTPIPLSSPGFHHYFTGQPMRMQQIRKPRDTHMFAEMLLLAKRYYNGAFFDDYLFDRGGRHEFKGMGVAYADGHSAFELTTPSHGGPPLWNAYWGYITSCPYNGCFWHPYTRTLNMF